MVRRKTIKHKRKTMKKMAKRSSRIKRRSKRKNRNTKRKMRGGEGEVKEMIENYERDILKNPKFAKENHEKHKKSKEEEPVIEEENVDVKIENKEKILEICLEACRILQPFIQAVYEVLNFDHFGKSTKENIEGKKELIKLIKSIKNGEISDVSQKKLNPNDVFTITDGMVQYIIRNYLFNNPPNFVGEETIDVQVISSDPDKVNYTLKQGTSDKPPDDIPPAFNKLISDAITAIKKKGFNKNLFENYIIFVDPIDGTAEYQGTDRRDKKEIELNPFTQKGEQATIIIGFADIVTKQPVGGIIFRPVKNEEKIEQEGTYAYGWVIDENDSNKNVYKSSLNMNAKAKKEGQIRFITSNGSISKPTKDLIIKIGGVREGSGGAGNKIMMLLEDKGDVYLQDRGLSRWDICAGEAILRCKGGLICKLTDFEKTGNTDSRYTYTTTTDDIFGPDNPNNNVDENKSAKYIEQNSVIPSDLVTEFKILKKREKEDDNKERLKDFFKLKSENGKGPIHHNATNNLCGLVAITEEKKYLLEAIHKKIEYLDPFKKEVVEKEVVEKEVVEEEVVEEEPDTGYKFDYD